MKSLEPKNTVFVRWIPGQIRNWKKKKERKRLGKWNRVRTIPIQVERGKRMENMEMSKRATRGMTRRLTFR